MKRKKIVVKLSSGLGNQMFIYGCGYCLAKKNDMDLEIDLSKYLLRITSSHYQLNDYNISCNNYLKFPFKNPGKSKLTHKLKRNIIGFRNHYFYNFLHECSFAKYYDIPVNPKKNNYLSGFYQAAGFVSECRDDLKKEFTPKVIRPIVSIRASQIEQKNICGIHVRRGDYLSFFGGSLSPDYYLEAIERIRAKSPEVQFLFFSDDIAYCKETFGHIENTTFIEPLFSGQEEMYLMTKCRQLIIANSTFSWWGAFLSEATRVICPLTEMWQKDYYLPEWEGLVADMPAISDKGLRHILK